MQDCLKERKILQKKVDLCCTQIDEHITESLETLNDSAKEKLDKIYLLTQREYELGSFLKRILRHGNSNSKESSEPMAKPIKRCKQIIRNT